MKAHIKKLTKEKTEAVEQVIEARTELSKLQATLEMAKISTKKELKHLDKKVDKKAMKEFESSEELKGLMEKAMKDFMKTKEFKYVLIGRFYSYLILEL